MWRRLKHHTCSFIAGNRLCSAAMFVGPTTYAGCGLTRLAPGPQRAADSTRRALAEGELLRKWKFSSGPLSASRLRLPCLLWDCCAGATTDM